MRLALASTPLALAAAPALAADEAPFEVRITIRDHRFVPAEYQVPAGRKLKLVVRNEDKTAEEFESIALRKEKIVKPGAEIVLEVRPLKPGRYKFFGEYHADTAVGYLIAK
ncbi:MAG: cupredoxin domain-containing protein [Rhodospirillaceae bacterium]|nr:cupredoxin domain-containing protein [Rhodospirillaceae bacterium]